MKRSEFTYGATQYASSLFGRWLSGFRSKSPGNKIVSTTKDKTMR
ncbi:hypothetical protein [Leptospira sp. Fiocruz LV4135]|nr:hypothetical protein [Leptospira sp. Fiocruz LV4135]